MQLSRTSSTVNGHDTSSSTSSAPPRWSWRRAPRQAGSRSPIASTRRPTAACSSASPSRPGVCGNGRTYIQTGPNSITGTINYNGVVYGNYNDGMRADPCMPGPVRVVIDRADKLPLSVQTYVGPADSTLRGVTDLGRVRAQDAADYLLVARRNDRRTRRPRRTLPGDARRQREHRVDARRDRARTRPCRARRAAARSRTWVAPPTACRRSRRASPSQFSPSRATRPTTSRFANRRSPSSAVSITAPGFRRSFNSRSKRRAIGWQSRRCRRCLARATLGHGSTCVPLSTARICPTRCSRSRSARSVRITRRRRTRRCSGRSTRRSRATAHARRSSRRSPRWAARRTRSGC